ncbi:MAG: pilus assembly protein N-terminal domain-containing protein [Deltaproteobacteria bacterium]|nr:pilus assembly protein N-terminal domain-containing protein [Deltaproteobacteria bacterium]
MFSLITSLWLAMSPAAWAQDEPAGSDWLDIELGKSQVVETPQNATVIAITDPAIADIIPMNSANKIQIQGKAVGSTDLIIQLGPKSEPFIYEITVHRDLTDLVRRIDNIVTGPPPKVYPIGDRIVVQGDVADLQTLEGIALVARIYDPEFVNLMHVVGDHQVQLEVVIAEVSRSGLRELGMNFLFGNSAIGAGLTSPSASSQLVTHPTQTLINGGVVQAAAAGTFQAATYISAANLGAVLSVLDDYKLSKVLAQPTMVCLSGQEAQFLAGGEIPIPKASGSGTISVQFKEYGVKMGFVPTVLGNNVIDTQVNVEMSEPDYGNATRATGLEIPGFRSRKGSTHLRLESGTTFAMMGLLSEQMTYSRAEFPGLGRIPVVGSLFRYTKHTREEKELMVFVTPRLVRPLAAGEAPLPPGVNEINDPGDLEFFFLGRDIHRSGTEGGPAGLMGLQRGSMQ